MLLSAPITGCTALAVGMKNLGEEQTDWTDLRRTNHAAADQLFQQAQNSVYSTQKIHLVQLNNLGTPPSSGVSPISWVIPQQIGNRFTSLGLKVVQPRTPSTTFSSHNQNIAKHLTQAARVETSHSQRIPSDLYLEGDYIYMSDSILVSLRLVEGQENTLLSSIDYSIDVNADTYFLLDAESDDSRIFHDKWMSFK